MSAGDRLAPLSMLDFALDYAAILVRWLHLIAGIAWIGASFYFVWLDNHIEKPDPPDERVAGELWAVHGGGFYNSRKYTVSPPRLPERLHWFKWEAYWTWISGFALFVLVYYAHPREYLVSPDRPGLASGWAIAISVGLLIIGSIGVYEILCRSPLGRDGRVLAALAVAGAALTGWALTEIYSGRGAFIQVGAMLGSIMAANVAHVIIPGQRRMVAAMREGREPDAEDGRRGKQRSMHNNYLTLPVLLLMLSNHWPAAYSDARPWLVIGAITAAGMLIRHFVNLRHKGRVVMALPATALAIFAVLGAYLAPRDEAPATAAPVPFAQIAPVIQARCAGCHAAAPTQPGYSVAPAGVRLDEPDLVVANARRIYDLAVTANAMPPGNVTGMTDAERELVGRWFGAGAEGP